MDQITTKHVLAAIDSFLQEQQAKKLEPEHKSLAAAQTKGDNEKVAEIQNNITAITEKYQRDPWCKDAGERMAAQLKFGTHMSKGIHPDSKGDNINATPLPDLPPGLVGSQSESNIQLDANGNAAALPLAGFMNTVVEAASATKLRDLILIQHPALKGAFNVDPEQSTQLEQAFRQSLQGGNTLAKTDERNKQLLWPIGENSIKENQYISLIPLHPSSLVLANFQKLIELRFGEANKEARENSKKNNKKNAVQFLPYVSVPNLAVKKLGGTKPQNVSQLNSQQGGKNLLLPSLPPTFESTKEFSISRSQYSFFGNSLSFYSKRALNELYAVVRSTKNNLEVRERRKNSALAPILFQVIKMADYIQTNANYPPGWSKDYQLDMPQKYWLDPKRAELEGEEDFKEGREQEEWIDRVVESFALWLNGDLRTTFKEFASDFNDAESAEWKREMHVAIKATQRAGSGVFQ